VSVRTGVPRFYFSLRSPYSWLAYRDLTDRYGDLADRLDWIPFWEPDELSTRLLTEAGGAFAYADMSRAKHLYVLQDIRRLAAERELTFRWPVDREPWWEVPHLAYLAARRAGRGRSFVDAAYRARWEQGRDICDRETVGELAVALGLDPAALVAAPQDPQLRAEGTQALLSAHRDGVFGVPFLIDRFDRYWGVDRLPAFVAAQAAKDASARTRQLGADKPGAEKAGAEKAGVEQGLVGAVRFSPGADAGHAGGCG
jgi:2-hydroxychromene-2-carboxylate isomerase